MLQTANRCIANLIEKGYLRNVSFAVAIALHSAEMPTFDAEEFSLVREPVQHAGAEEPIQVVMRLVIEGEGLPHRGQVGQRCRSRLSMPAASGRARGLHQLLFSP